MALCRDSVIGLRHKILNLLLPAGDNCQSRGLNTAAGQLRIVLAGQSSGSIDSHQPVCFRPAHGGIIEIVVFMAIFQLRKSVLNGLVRDRRNPESLDRLPASGFLQDQPGHQFPLPACICGDNDLAHILPMKLRLDRAELFSRLFDHFQLKLLRHHGKVFHLPRLILRVVIFRVRQRHQMPQPPGYNILIALQRAVLIPSAAKDPGNITRHRRLFCNY